MKNFKLALNSKAGRLRGFFYKDRRWITNGKVMAVDALWNWTDKRILDSFAAGKNWGWNQTFLENEEMPDGIPPMLDRAGQEFPLIYKTAIRFQEYRVFLGGGTRCLVLEDFLHEMVDTYHYDVDQKIVIGKNLSGDVILIFRDGEHLELQFQRELDALKLEKEVPHA